MATFENFNAKLDFIDNYLTSLDNRQKLSSEDIGGPVVRTNIISRMHESKGDSKNPYKYWFTNLQDQDIFDEYVAPKLEAFLSDKDLIDGFDTEEDMRDYLNENFSNPCSVSVNIFEDDEEFDPSELGRGIELSGTARTYKFEIGDGIFVDRLGLRLTVVHKPERRKALGASASKSFRDRLSALR